MNNSLVHLLLQEECLMHLHQETAVVRSPVRPVLFSHHDVWVSRIPGILRQSLRKGHMWRHFPGVSLIRILFSETMLQTGKHRGTNQFSLADYLVKHVNIYFHLNLYKIWKISCTVLQKHQQAHSLAHTGVQQSKQYKSVMLDRTTYT